MTVTACGVSTFMSNPSIAKPVLIKRFMYSLGGSDQAPPNPSSPSSSPLSVTDYDKGFNTFSPGGRLFQVEYAAEAIKLGSIAIGLRTKGVEKRMISPSLGMASSIFSYFQNMWPFSKSKADDLKISTQLVHKLSIPVKTKHFVFAIREPDSGAVVYILANQCLSLQSALDAEYLIKEVQPKLVVVQVSPSALADIRAEEKCLRNDHLNDVPASYFGVLKRCFYEKINKNQYESYAGIHVLQEIFGVGFYGHFLTAKRAAREAGSHFMLLESPYEKTCTTTCVESDKDGGKHQELHLHSRGLILGRVTSTSYSSSERLRCDGSLQFQTIRSVVPSLDLIISKHSLADHNPEVEPEQVEPISNYKVPQFAQSFYSLLVDLHDIFIELPSISKAMVSVQKMLTDINDGQPVNTRTLANVYIFRIAVEGLRIALNHSARCPLEAKEKINLTKSEFSELPSEEKSHILFVQALRSQAKKYESVVAIVDASCLAGLRRYWNTSVPLKITELTDFSFTEYSDDDLDANDEKVEGAGKTGLLAEKPVVAVGAGASAILGASSLTKALPASFVKLATSQIPSTLKFGVANLQRATAIGLGKILGSSNPVIHGLVSAGTKPSTLKFTASAEKIRAITHTMITSAERTSLLAMRTSFYEIMRRRSVRPFRFAPMVTFTCSMVACTGLLAYGDGLECAAESLPSVPMIASLGRGLQSLHQASKEVRMTNGSKMQETLQSLFYNLTQMRTQ